MARQEDGAEGMNRDSERLAEPGDELTDFVYAVSHDFRAPMVNIKGLSDELLLALRDLEPLLQPDALQLPEAQVAKVRATLSSDLPESLRHISQCVAKMDRMMKRLVELSRIDRIQLAPEEFDFEERVKALASELGVEASGKTLQVQAESRLQVFVDSNVFDRIMRHLLKNAFTYRHPDRVPQVIISADAEEEGALAISVSDNGRGIAEADLHRIFAPFRRAGKQDCPGEGMGLTFARALARKGGGSISCSSRLGEGSTFTLRLPQPVLEAAGQVSGEMHGQGSTL